MRDKINKLLDDLEHLDKIIEGEMNTSSVEVTLTFDEKARTEIKRTLREYRLRVRNQLTKMTSEI